MSFPETTSQPNLTLVSNHPTNAVEFVNNELEADMLANTDESFHEIFRYTLLDRSTSRIRPVLTLITGEALGLSWEATQDLAFGIEKFHNMSLIEDDMPYEDNSESRRGKPSAWIQFGIRQAHMAALAMFNSAYASVARNDAKGYLGGALNRYVQTSIDQLLVDQNSDLDSFQAGKPDIQTVKELDQIAAGKTGLLFEMSTRGVAMLAGAPPHTQARLQAYGTHVGLAKQVRNDLTDLAERGDDERNGKPSYPSVMGGIQPVEAKLQAHIDRAVAVIEPLSGDIDITDLVRVVRHIGRQRLQSI